MPHSLKETVNYFGLSKFCLGKLKYSLEWYRTVGTGVNQVNKGANQAVRAGHDANIVAVLHKVLSVGMAELYSSAHLISLTL